MPYTAIEFARDLPLLPEIDTPEWDPPWHTGPQVQLDGMILRLPVRRLEDRLHVYFCHRYGDAAGPEYCREFLAILEYIRNAQGQLIQDGLVRRVEDHLELTDAFVHFFLNGSLPPQDHGGSR